MASRSKRRSETACSQSWQRPHFLREKLSDLAAERSGMLKVKRMSRIGIEDEVRVRQALSHDERVVGWNHHVGMAARHQHGLSNFSQARQRRRRSHAESFDRLCLRHDALTTHWWDRFLAPLFQPLQMGDAFFSALLCLGKEEIEKIFVVVDGLEHYLEHFGRYFGSVSDTARACRSKNEPTYQVGAIQGQLLCHATAH